MRRRQRGLQSYRKKKTINTAAVREFSAGPFSLSGGFSGIMVIWSVGPRQMIGVPMEPGLTNGQDFVNRLVYRFFSPKAGM
ncbi:MAG: hypothetical protein ACLR9I_01730 [Eisenbergiella sp.]